MVGLIRIKCVYRSKGEVVKGFQLDRMITTSHDTEAVDKWAKSPSVVGCSCTSRILPGRMSADHGRDMHKSASYLLKNIIPWVWGLETLAPRELTGAGTSCSDMLRT